MRKFSSKLAGQQSGFTLIELVIVIVIIGILAAVAIPNFADLTEDAKQSTVDGIAANLSSASAANAAVCQGASSLISGSTKCTLGITSCSAALATLLNTPTTTATATTGTATGTCKVTGVGTGAKTSKDVFVKFTAS